MSKLINLSGKQFGDWKVIKYIAKRKFLCKCKCGYQTEVLNYHLLSGASTKCRYCSNTQIKTIANNSKYGTLLVLSNYTKKGTTYCKCKCNCGKITHVDAYQLRNHKIKSCKNCSNYKGYKDISLSYWNNFKRSCLKRGYQFNITMQQVWNMYEKQNKQCKLSGVTIQFCRSFRKNQKHHSVSIDRIDNNKGYTIDNIQLIHKKINIMRHVMSISEFIKWCELIYKHSI